MKSKTLGRGESRSSGSQQYMVWPGEVIAYHSRDVRSEEHCSVMKNPPATASSSRVIISKCSGANSLPICARNFIREYGNVGTVDEPREYIAGTLEMMMVTERQFQLPLAFFGGQTDKTLVGPGGSARNLIGYRRQEEEESTYQ